MPKVRITQADIANLGRKLEGMEAGLSEAERALLVAVFHLASEAINAEGAPASAGPGEADPATAMVVTAEESLPSVRGMFEAAFMAGALTEAMGGLPMTLNIVGDR